MFDSTQTEGMYFMDLNKTFQRQTVKTIKMKTKILVILTIGVMISSIAYANEGGIHARKMNSWTELGSKHVNWRVDKDVLYVGPYEGVFNKLKIKVTGGTVHMIRMVVTYGNGAKDEIPLRHVFTRGSESRVIDLRGGNRVIKKITFVYERNNISRKARVWVAGL